MSSPVTISEWQAAVHQVAVDKGWHERPLMTEYAGRPDVDGVAAKIALMHSELSEALEELRKPDVLGVCVALDTWYRMDNDKPEGFVVELADCVIRIMDTCEALGLDLQAAMGEKAAYNKTRTHRHGGKAL